MLNYNYLILIGLKAKSPESVTAYFTLKNKMGYKQVTSVKKWTLWEIKFSKELSSKQILKFKDLIYNSFLFLNPTKEFYKFFPDEKLFKDDFYGLIKVAEIQQHNEKIITKIKQKISSNILDVEKWTVWEILADRKITKKNLRQQNFLLSEMAFSSSANKGLFCNPHYQKFEIEIK